MEENCAPEDIVQMAAEKAQIPLMEVKNVAVMKRAKQMSAAKTREVHVFI